MIERLDYENLRQGKILMTTVYFVRHAEPDLSNHNDLTRDLTPKGIKDRKFLIDYFKNKKLDVAFSSPFKRAIRTIEPVAKSRNLKINQISEFCERKIGDEWISNFHEYCQKQWFDFDYKLENGESLNDTQKRNINALKNILAHYPDKNIIIGSHGTAIGTIINYFDKSFDYEKFQQIQPIMPFIVKFDFYAQKVNYKVITINKKR